MLLGHWDVVERALAAGKYTLAACALLSAVSGSDGRQDWKEESRAKRAVAGLRERYDEQVNPWLGGKKKEDPRRTPVRGAACRAGPTAPRAVRAHARSDRRAKDRHGALDFDDLEAGAQALLRREDPEPVAKADRRAAGR